jgi:hypothetical protein
VTRQAYPSAHEPVAAVTHDRGGAGAGRDNAARTRRSDAERAAPARRGAHGTAPAGAACRQTVTAAPDLAAAVVAFRSWRLAGERLMSPFIPCRWQDRVMHATCFDANRTLTRSVGWLEEPHRSPHQACQCGIYAYHTPGPRSWFGEAYWCEGVVSTWGRLVVHTDGFRAEHARVEALAVPDGRQRFGAANIRRAAADLDVPVLAHDELESFAARLGGGVPVALRPTAPTHPSG